ncbi:MAG: RlmE family RNA methyltransferase [Rickettsiales bacterium]|jgi:23S rRNA (uridine2552-2'-O)-methyltransferase|nr:RlmE family RNA methyltransferase [Rickettsiales bacterium]
MPRILSKKISKSKSSSKWMARQLADPYVAKAHAEGYRCRAAYKIAEINEQFHILKPGQVVVDLGAAPGGWSQYIAKNFPNTRVIAMDLLPMKPIKYASPAATNPEQSEIPASAGMTKEVEFYEGDFTTDEAIKWLDNAVGGGKVDAVLSDMAPNTTGHAKTDHLRQMVLLEYAWDFAKANLKKGGAFVAKSFTGGTTNELLAGIKPMFEKVRHVKPESSRKESVEMFIVATGFKG